MLKASFTLIASLCAVSLAASPLKAAPAASKPVASKPAASKPVASKPVASKPAANKTIRGVVTTKSGVPLVGVTLYWLDLPGSQYLENLGDGNRVVTGDKGEFTWVVPANLAWNVSLDSSSSAPTCYALPQDASWKAKVVLARPDSAQSDLRTLMEDAALRCQTRWRDTPAGARISVIVPDSARVAFKLRAPDGSALIRQPVELVAPGAFSDYAGAVVYQGQTDAAGNVEWRGYTGLKRLLISVKGVGFGSTGTLELLPNQKVVAQVPSLAPFASIEGTVAPALAAPKAKVRAELFDGAQHQWYIREGAVDAAGRFRIDDLLPGLTTLQIVGAKRQPRSVSLDLEPGQHKSGIVLQPEPAPVVSKGAAAPSLDTPSSVFARSAAPAAPKSSLSGRVSDVAGAPVKGAQVYALCTYDGGIRQYQEIAVALSRADGTYSIAALPGAQPRVAVVAVQAGHPPALANASINTASPDAATSPRSLRADLVIPAGHPALKVRVARAGAPLAGAAVQLSPQAGTGLFDVFYVGSARSDASKKLRALLLPTARTDARGEATFADLTPGLWDITASAGDQSSLNSVGSWTGNVAQKTAYNIVRGVAVRSGETRQVGLSVYPQTGALTLQLQRPDGSAPKVSTVAIAMGLAAADFESNTSFEVDARGRGDFALQSSGLWALRTRFRDSALDSVPASAEPFYESSAIVAISPSFPRNGPLLLRSIRRDRGLISVALRDENGQSVAGSVWIGDGFDSALYGASVRPDAPAVFAAMPSGKYLLKATYAGRPDALEFGNDSAHFPDDAALTGRRQLVAQTVEVQAGQSTIVSFEPQLQGYVRGKVSGVDDAANYAVYIPFYSETPIRVGYDASNGEFVAGPFPAGKTQLLVQRTKVAPGQTRDEGKYFPVDIVAGGVAHVTLEPLTRGQSYAGDATETALTMGGIFHSNRDKTPAARVFLPDGVTPAWGARAAIFAPATWQPVRLGRVDARGYLTPVDSWYSDGQPELVPAGSPTEPTLMVWLPGANGAAIVPLKDATKTPIILPKSAAIRGRVTLAGQAINKISSSFTVVAAYQGRGKLNPLLSVETTAAPDGSFELSGLTPGIYRVQAARDGIWLSATQTVEVSGGETKLAFNIAAAGAPTTLRLVNAKREPLIERPLILMRPAGPFTERYWPATLTTDSAGEVRLEGLEAGQQQFGVTLKSGELKTFKVLIAPFASGQTAQIITLVAQ